MKGMIGVLEQLQGRERRERGAERFELGKVGERIAGPLQEEHRNAHVEKMVPAIARWPARGMEGKAKESKAAHTWKRGCRLGLRGHPAAKGFTAGDQRQA